MIPGDAARLEVAGAPALDLPRLGFGSAAVGNLYSAVSADTAEAAIAAAVDAGISYFDTAPHYGFGLSELRLGRALPPATKVSTKVGRVLDPLASVSMTGERQGFVDAEPYESRFDYSYDGVMRAFEGSLKRLGRDKVDLLLVHDLGEATHGAAHDQRYREFLSGGLRAMSDLRDAGVAGALGVGINEWQAAETVLAQADLQVVLLAGRYTLLEQSALNSFLPLCARRNVKVVVGGPFNSGALVETPPAGGTLHYDYAAAPVEVTRRVDGLRAVCASHDIPLAAAALQFPLAHPQVSTVIPGLASAGQVHQALEWFERSIPAGLWRDLKSEGLLRADAPVPEPVV